jgi:hypothetical protein
VSEKRGKQEVSIQSSMVPLVVMILEPQLASLRIPRPRLHQEMWYLHSHGQPWPFGTHAR